MARISRAATAALVGALLLQACSSRPRTFIPVLQAPPADEAALQAALNDCNELIASGKWFRSDRTASGGAGAAAGLATGAAGTAVASSVAGWSGMAVMGATVVLAPFAVLGGAWSLAKAKKIKKERRIQAATSECLRGRGYEVANWERAPKK